MARSVFELPELAVLPNWLHPELLEDLSLVALVSITLVALLAFRLIRRLVLRGVVVGLLLVVLLWAISTVIYVAFISLFIAIAATAFYHFYWTKKND